MPDWIGLVRMCVSPFRPLSCYQWIVYFRFSAGLAVAFFATFDTAFIYNNNNLGYLHFHFHRLHLHLLYKFPIFVATKYVDNRKVLTQLSSAKERLISTFTH